VTDRRRFLAKAGLVFKHSPVQIDDNRQNKWQSLINESPESVKLEIKNIIDVPHFVEKSGAPLLQLADACAFAFRRCLSGQPHGDDLVYAMLGNDWGKNFCDDPVWRSKTSSGLFNTQFYWSEEQKRDFENSRIAAWLAGAIGSLDGQ
jgi:hypothetical protein